MAAIATSATAPYSADYFSARERFVDACTRLGWEHRALPIDAKGPGGETLTIDVAVGGSPQPTTAIVTSCGIHGVEGLFGSAVQLAYMERLLRGWRPPEGAALVMLHALNPFGFAWRRRFNENNVDLNRNFLLENQEYRGAPPLSARFRSVLMPSSFHRRFGIWPARMALLAMRHGMGAFWQTMPVGQYEFPDWLFFGGSARTQTAEILDDLLPELLGSAREVVHLDFHTGLGRWSECELLLGDDERREHCEWWHAYFRETRVKESIATTSPYAIRGGFGPWLQARFPQCCYRYAVAEFGTYSPRRVLQALAEELHWHAQVGTSDADHWSRRQLADIFVPQDQGWRDSTLATGLALIDRATEVLWPSLIESRGVQAAAGAS
jgi:hypothetical protein